MTRVYYLAKLLLSRLLIKVERTALNNYTRFGRGKLFFSVIILSSNAANDYTQCVSLSN